MATIKPFIALRPTADKAKTVACVPYDVIYDTEVRSHIENNSLSFLRVTRAEGEFPAGQTVDTQEVFQRARKNLEEFIREGVLVADKEPAFYVYRLASETHSQTGLIACCSLDEYESGQIKKHEKVRPDKVEDRTRHMLAVRAQTGLIFLTFRGTDRVHELLDSTAATEPIYEFECPLGTVQSIWRADNVEDWRSAFGDVPSLYIADGHHRAESALKARNELRAADPSHTGSENYNFVVAGLFPAEDLQILPYNRVVHDLNGLSKDEFLSRVTESFVIIGMGNKTPENHGELSMYLDGEWYGLRFAVNYIREPDAVEGLDVSILQSHILEPILGIRDPRTDERIGFVGGLRGTIELERMVDSGTAAVAFSLYPTTMEDLLTVSDMGEIMPPKSTWFEPKLKDGLLVHEI